jgi:MFS family permease
MSALPPAAPRDVRLVAPGALPEDEARLYGLWRRMREVGPSPAPAGDHEAARRIRLLAASQTVSRAGSNGAVLALQYLVLVKTGSAAWVAASLLASMLVRLGTAPYGGLLADRWDRRRLLIGSEIVAAAVWVGCALVSAPALLIAGAALATAAQAPFRPAAVGTLARMVPEDQLRRANAAFAGADATGLLVGPPLAGLIITATSPTGMFWLNAATFVLSAGLLRRLPRIAGERRSRRVRASHLLAGFAHVRRRPSLRLVALTAALVLGSSGLVNVAEPLLARSFGAGALAYGLLSGGWAFGSLVGAQIGALTGATATRAHAAMIGCMALAAPATALIALAGVLAGAVALTALMGVGMGVFLVSQLTLVQQDTPDRLIGRVAAAVDACGSLAFVAGAVVSVFLVPAGGISAAYAGAALLLALACAALVGVARTARPLALGECSDIRIAA